MNLHHLPNLIKALNIEESKDAFMKYSSLGRTGVKVSRIALGGMSYGSEVSWMVREPEAIKIINKAIDLGINFIDTADVYSEGESERIIGKAIKGRRDDIILATKVGLEFGSEPNNTGLSSYRLIKQLNGSLERLGTDHVELYQIHRWDYNTDIRQTLETLNQLVNDNRVYYIGATSIYSFQIERIVNLSEKNGWARIVSHSPRYNLVYREEEREVIPLCRELGIAIIPYSPLGRGFLTGKYKRNIQPNTVRYRSDRYFAGGYFSPDDFDVLEELEEVAKEKGVTHTQVALAWLFSKDWITSPIVGITKEEYLNDAVAALDLKLLPDDIKRLEGRYKPHQLHGPVRSPLAP